MWMVGCPLSEGMLVCLLGVGYRRLGGRLSAIYSTLKWKTRCPGRGSPGTDMWIPIARYYGRREGGSSWSNYFLIWVNRRDKENVSGGAEEIICSLLILRFGFLVIYWIWGNRRVPIIIPLIIRRPVHSLHNLLNFFMGMENNIYLPVYQILGLIISVIYIYILYYLIY